MGIEQPEDADTTYIMLYFEPLATRKVADIRGRILLNRETRELKSIDFSYAGRNLPLRGDQANGRVEFSQLPTGRWLVSSWYIRIPQAVVKRAPPGGGEPEWIADGFLLQGGRVLSTAVVPPER